MLVPVVTATHGEYDFYGFSEPSGDVGGDLVDVVGGDAGWVGYEHAKQLAAAHSTQPLAETAERLVASARAHGAQMDDQTVLLIRRRV